MQMKQCILMTLLTLVARLSFAGEVPIAIKELAKKQQTPVAEYVFHGKTLFLLDSRGKCCDLGASVYTADGELYCRYIGLAGAWESKCQRFDEEAEFVREIEPASSGF